MAQCQEAGNDVLFAIVLPVHPKRVQIHPSTVIQRATMANANAANRHTNRSVRLPELIAKKRQTQLARLTKWEVRPSFKYLCVRKLMAMETRIEEMILQ